MEPLQLRRTKLYRPRATGDLLHRTRVCAILDRHMDRAMTLVCAPAGFGKTTLLSDWLEHGSCLNAWLALDERDSDLDVFLSYFVAAIRTLFPNACADTLTLLQSPVMPPLAPLVTALTNDLEALLDEGQQSQCPRFVLVLDDYHLVSGPAVHALLGELIRHPPRNLHLIISTRQDPPIQLHALRAHEELGEIRVQDLRFTAEEVTAFMSQALDTPLNAGDLEALVERTEGWVTGLRLAALSLNIGSDITGQVTEFTVDNRYVLGYLVSEVFSRVPIATQNFLLKTAILDRLCGPLCDAVAGPPSPTWDSRAYLAWMAEENLFTFSLDAQGVWYRYHRLFQTLLRGRLERQFSPEEIAELHARATAWYAQKGNVEDAIRHALAAGDELAAIRLLESHRHQEMNQEHWRQLERWLELMPRRLIDTRPELLMLEIWLLQKQWRYMDIPPYLDRIETLVGQTPLPETDRMRLQSEIDTLNSAVAYYVFDGERARSCAHWALQTAPLECSFVRATAWLYYGAARQMTGDIQDALDSLYGGLGEDRLHGNAFPSRLYIGICFVHWMGADYANLLRVATQLLQLARQRDLTEAIGWAHYFRGCALYHLNDLRGAEDEFREVVRQRYLAHAYAFSQGAFGLASVLRARGEYEPAGEIVESVAAYALEMKNPRITADAELFRASLAAQRGAVAEARRWIGAHDIAELSVPLSTFHSSLVVYARILIRMGTRASLQEAAQTLARIRDITVPSHNTRYIIELLALEGLLRDAQGDQAGALASLQEAVALAEPSGTVRVFVDLGPRMATLLRSLAAQGAAPEYLPGLLAAFGELRTPSSKPTPPAPSQPGLIEPLSERELEVLELLGQRLTNKEIARALTISEMTVKRHAVNIYQKLAVGNRRDAVARAIALGLLTAIPRPYARFS